MKILVADDHALFRDGLKLVLKELDGDTDILEATTTAEAMDQVAKNPDIDMILLDLSMPGQDGFTALDNLRDQYPEIPVVIVSATEDNLDIQRVMSLGAAGFISKSTPGSDIVAALLRVLGGQTFVSDNIPSTSGEANGCGNNAVMEKLTQRQRQVLQLMCAGMSNKKIADQLSMAEGTVKIHVTAIFKALNVTSRTQAVLIANQSGNGSAE